MDQPEHLPVRPGSTPATGTTSITDSAVAKVAAVAARAVPGVQFLGLGSSRALGALRGAVGAGEGSPGVSAEVGQHEVAVDIVLTAAYGRPLQQIAEDVRAAVYLAVERITGLHVIEVNIEIGDVHLPETADETPSVPVAQHVPQPPDRTPPPPSAAPRGGYSSETMEQP